jgi:hypothetical protein
LAHGLGLREPACTAEEQRREAGKNSLESYGPSRVEQGRFADIASDHA